MTQRPTFEETFLSIAKTLSQRATCPRRSIGAVIADADNRILGAGYNGSPSGLPHCTEVGCVLKGDSCSRSVHGELNAILNSNAARLAGATVYIWGCVPCYRCAQAIATVGITKVVSANTNYRPDEAGRSYGQLSGEDLLKEGGVELCLLS